MTTRLFRRDFGTLGEVERTPQGGYKIPAFLTRAGVFVYHTDDGKTIREWRPSSEVFRPETLDSLKAAPLTLDHPPARVDTVNFRQFSSGHVADDVRRDGDKTAATVYAQDDRIVRAIDSGRRELSCGYHCDVDETAGTVPAGEPDAGLGYDRIQRGILYNHTALVQNGRAGSAVRLRLDSAGNSFDEDSMPDKKIEIINGVEHEVGTAAHTDARTRMDSAISDGQKTFAKLTKQRDDAVKVAQLERTRADTAASKLVKLTEDVKKAFTPERLDAAVRTRAVVVEKAAKVMGKDWKADGKTNDAIKREVLAKVRPDIRLDSLDIKTAWAMIATEAPAAAAGNQRRDAAGNVIPAVPSHLVAPPPEQGQRSDDKGKPVSTISQIRSDAAEAEGQRWQKPLAVARKGAGGVTNQAAQIESMK